MTYIYIYIYISRLGIPLARDFLSNSKLPFEQIFSPRLSAFPIYPRQTNLARHKYRRLEHRRMHDRSGREVLKGGVDIGKVDATLVDRWSVLPSNRNQPRLKMQTSSMAEGKPRNLPCCARDTSFEREQWASNQSSRSSYSQFALQIGKQVEREAA